MCRISDYFSYDDIEDSEIHGETMLRLSTANFSAELQRLRDAIPESVKMNCGFTLSTTGSKLTITNRHDTLGMRYA
jgi:hypothetical protein